MELYQITVEHFYVFFIDNAFVLLSDFNFAVEGQYDFVPWRRWVDEKSGHNLFFKGRDNSSLSSRPQVSTIITCSPVLLFTYSNSPVHLFQCSPALIKKPAFSGLFYWAVLDLNQRPPACRAPWQIATIL